MKRAIISTKPRKEGATKRWHRSIFLEKNKEMGFYIRKLCEDICRYTYTSWVEKPHHYIHIYFCSRETIHNIFLSILPKRV